MPAAGAWTNRSTARRLVAPLLAVVVLAGAAPATSAVPAAPKCTITGTPGNDVLHGSKRADVICGRGGHDRIHGRAGNDWLVGGAGHDRLVGGPGHDRILGGAGRDHLFGGHGRDRLFGGQGDDTNLPGPILKVKRLFQVNVKPTYDVPEGTLVTWKPLGGTCVEDEANVSDTVVSSRTDYTFAAFFAVTGEAWEACAYSRSNSWFRATFRTLAGNEWFRDVNVTQSSLPTIVEHTFKADCDGQAGNAICHSGSDTSFSQLPVSPPIKFGPLRDPEPPPVPPTLQCRGVTHFSIGDTLRDFHPCTSEGYPLPTLSYDGGTIPSSITASRYPNTAGSWIVLNGRFTKPGRYVLKVTGRVPGGWTGHDEAVFEVSD